MSDRKRWKRHELRVAKRLGTTRNPSNGRRCTDIDAGPFAIEYKIRESAFPAWLENALIQARIGALANGLGQTPIVVLTQVDGGARAKPRDYVLWSLDDFIAWHGDRLGLGKGGAA